MSVRKTGLMPLRTQDAQVNRWADGVLEQLEVLHGARGDPLNRALTLRDLQAIGFDVNVLMANSRGGGITVRPGGAAAAAAPLVDAAATKAIERADMDAFAKAITETALFKDLMAPLKWQDVRDPSRFNWVPEQLRRELLTSIAEEASRRGTDITKVETIVKDGAARFARQLEEITAAMGEAAAGVRQLSFAYADADRAIAGQVTQLGVSLGKNIATLEQSLSTEVTKTTAIASSVTTLQTRVGTAESAISNEQTARANADLANATSINQVQARLDNGDFAAVKTQSSATASKVAGYEARYTVKVTAGGAWAGIGLAATDNGAGNATSAIIMAADKFAIVAPGYSGGMTTVPPAGSVPFGVENLPSGGSRIYMDANVQIRGGLDVTALYGSGIWADAAVFTVYAANPFGGFSSYGGMSPSRSIAVGNDSARLYAGHYGKAMGSSALSVGIIGEAVGQGNTCAGIVGTATGANSYGGVFYGQSVDISLSGSGVISWSGILVQRPNGLQNYFLNGIGQWVKPFSSLAKSDITSALGYVPPSPASVSDEITTNTGNCIRYTGATTSGPLNLAGYAQIVAGGNYYWIPIYL
ncbi:coiled-coil domain-containing protein [Giesbergeria anulus]|uniref:Uncharacterized protein n=1 Tax=Giesbergeria anulus TaxID=180197 RepID=A0A1H9E2N8_9BURK|nr:DUF1983 domain-containing protein [Giesbergeria anulus]SEQ19867.1 protein of unknown function [Giesbergeria anulus]